MVIAKGTSRKRVDLPVEVTFKEVIVSGDSAGATNYLFIQRDIMHNVRRDQSLKTTPSMYALLAFALNRLINFAGMLIFDIITVGRSFLIL